MLFNSYVFLCLFLPITLLGFVLAARAQRAGLLLGWLNAVSLFFYGWWAPRYVVLLLASVVVNFALGRVLVDAGRTTLVRRRWLIFGIVANLLALGYFKYAAFFAQTFGAVTGARVTIPHIILPLGISFFTFTQIAFLVDTFRKPDHSRGTFWQYLLFVCFFPHLLAGPIVHHGDLMPQMKTSAFRRVRMDNLVVGGALFIVGLWKKVIVADTFAVVVGPVFDAAAGGRAPGLAESWIGALSYALQLYFDFSGYSDMAIGLARMFGLRFPENFNSPYKARSIVEFWRRWHMTLSAFLRDYLYIALGGNRRGSARRYINLFLTMLLGGLWHGAGWTFVIWGALHGGYLIVNHAIVGVRKTLEFGPPHALTSLLGGVVTFLAVLVGWVFFRAPSLDGARAMLAGMVGAHGVALPPEYLAAMGALGRALQAAGVQASDLILLPRRLSEIVPELVLAYAVVFLAPNTTQIFASAQRQLHPPSDSKLTTSLSFQPSVVWAVALGVALTLSLAAVAGRTEFLYFQF